METQKMPLGRVRIKSVPQGEAPLEIRQKWIGTEMPCAAYDRTCLTGGIVSGRPQGYKAGYIIFEKDALDALEARAPDAARWWHELGFPRSASSTFFFDADCIEVIEPPIDMADLKNENN